jgi:hypothetical protein
MRFLVLIAGVLGVSGAAAASDLQSAYDGADAAAGQVVYEARFGGDRPTLAHSSFQLRFGSDYQFQTHQRASFVAEYRPATDSVLVNGLDVSPMLINRQAEEGFFASTIGGWIPLLIVITAASFIVIDGNDLTAEDLFGTGSSGS